MVAINLCLFGVNFFLMRVRLISRKSHWQNNCYYCHWVVSDNRSFFGWPTPHIHSVFTSISIQLGYLIRSRHSGGRRFHAAMRVVFWPKKKKTVLYNNIILSVSFFQRPWRRSKIALSPPFDRNKMFKNVSGRRKLKYIYL